MDKIGIVCSVVCLIHCFLVPFLALSSQIVAIYFESELVHLTFLLFMIPLALISFSRQRKIHGHLTPSVLGYLGVVFLVFSFMGNLYSVPEFIKIILNFSGGIVLIAGHYLNIKKSRANSFLGDC